MTLPETAKQDDEKWLKFGRYLASPPPGQKVVISGIAGYFPESDNMYELRHNLLNHVDMVTEDERRWKKENPRIPQRTGKIKKLSKFDASFFGFQAAQANSMCPMLRCLLERTYEAIIDAGINPVSLKGTRTGVYLSSCFTEFERLIVYETPVKDGFPITGCGRGFSATRISYWLGVQGPSIITDSACSSGLFALNHAYEDLHMGVIDYAIVGASNLCLDPSTSLQFAGLGVLSPDGRVKAFDQNADGYARAEAAAIIFLQRAKYAKRIYCTVVHSKVNCDGYKPQGITYPSSEMQEELLREFYKECGVDPGSVDYVEAHGTGTQVGDPEEVNAIERVFCMNRTTPLLIGSNKSNLGHSEPASGICSTAKVILTFETGIIPANLHYKIPRENIPGLKNGKLKVITENTPFMGQLVGINSFGFGGANAHVLVQKCEKQKVNRGAPKDSLPRLVVASGRTKEGVETILNDVESRPVDVEFISLLHDIQAINIPGHMYRGYTLLVPGGPTRRHLQYYDRIQHPVWFVFSDLGHEWMEMGQSLLQIPIFAATIKKCSQVLKPYGINVEKIISTNNSNAMENTKNIIICGLAIQLGLVDIMSCVGITADGLLGHKIGEIACAYAVGSVTLEQAMMVAHYSVLDLSKQDLLKHLLQIISNPKPCSNCWVRTSEEINYKPTSASAEYFTNCLLGSSIFEEKISLVPDKAVIIHLSSQADVKNILAKSKTKNVTSLHLDSEYGSNGVEQVMVLLGKLYEIGIQMQLSKLYPQVQYPVSCGTPMISPLIRWEHSKDWQVYRNSNIFGTKSEKLMRINVADSKDEFYKGHVIDGRNLFPATGYLFLTWETFCQCHEKTSLMSVVFEDVRFERATTLPADGQVKFIVSIQRHNGQFEVAESGAAIVTGRIRKLEDTSREMLLGPKLPKPARGEDIMDLHARDIYKELRLRGYNYSGVFRGLVSIDNIASTGSIHWSDNWVGFMDTMLQMRILAKDTRSLYVPTFIDKIIIDVEKHFTELSNCKEENLLPIYAWNMIDVVQSGGVEIQRLGAAPITRRKPLGDPVLERYQFLPHMTSSGPTMNLEQTVRMYVHLVLENHLGIKVRCYELAHPDSELFAPLLVNILGDLPLIQAEIVVLAGKNSTTVQDDLGPGIQVLPQDKPPADHSALLVAGSGLLQNCKLLKDTVDTLADDGCILTKEHQSVNLQASDENNLQIVADKTVGEERIVLLKKRQSKLASPVVVKITGQNLSWLTTLQAAVRDCKPPQRVMLVAQGEPLSGVLGLFNCIRKEPGGDMTRCFFILDSTAPQFDPSLPLYSQQLEKDLAVNVLRDGEWGSYRHLLLEPSPKITSSHGYNNVLLRGDLSTLTWLEGPLGNAVPEDKQNLVHIYYSALNFRDVMMSTGKLSPDSITSERTKMDILQGFEFSGRDANGRRVMGIETGCLANVIKPEYQLLWQVPDEWTLEDAATVPIVYCTVIYALRIEGEIEPGQTILIHAGSGGVGQAAINYCLHHGLTVYTTVGTQAKREFIKKQFPQIMDDHIGNSRDTTFEEFIMERTNGRGVDLVLNSLAEEKLKASIRCLARGGRFLEIGKFDMSKNSPLGLEMFAKDQSFHSIMLDVFFSTTIDYKRKMLLLSILEDAIKEGSVKPLVRTVYDTSEVEQAFRFMAGGRHIGKVLIKIRPEEDEQLVEPTPLTMEVVPRFHCNPHFSYIILGGLGGFGLELTDWLVLRGARKIVLTSRRGITTGYQSLRVRIWRSYGATVCISTVDVSTEEGVRNLLNEANSIAPVGGIFNLAVVLRDALLENQTEETFKESFKGKALATHHLDKLSRQLCPRIQNFVVFSSVSCGRGNAGQTNYGMSNSVMERICEARVRDGLPGIAIQWGAVGEVGLVAEMQEEQHELVIGGTLQQRISSCLEVLDSFLKQPHPVVASMVVAEKRVAGGKYGDIVDSVANILGIRDLKTVSALSTLTELGMDSMMAVEIKQVIEHEYEVFLTPQEIRNLTIKQLQELAATDSPKEQDKAQQQASEFVFQLIGNQETGSQIVLPLPSLNTGSTPVFMIPGMEGIASALEQLSKNLVAPCVGLQLCYHNTGKTVPDMAAHLLPHMHKQLVPDKPFILVGHSFGGLMALELAALLENKGWLGHVFLLDASPEFTSRLVREHLLNDDNDDEAAIQIALLCRLLHFTAPTYKQNIEEFAAALKQLSSWDERIEKLLYFTPELERDYQRAIVNAIYTHIGAIINYKWPESRTLQSNVTLIRPKNSLIKMDGDCGLSKICQKAVTVHSVDGDHMSMLENPGTAEIINKILEA